MIHDYLDEKQLRKQIISCDDMIIDLYFSKEKQKTKKDIVNSDLIKNIYA